MKSEDLFISEPEIKIFDVFVNHGKASKNVLMAFPMPDIIGDVDFKAALPTYNPGNSFNDQVKADGKPLVLASDQHVVVIGKSKTARMSRKS